MKIWNAKLISLPCESEKIESKWNELHQSSSFRTPFQTYGFFRSWLLSLGKGTNAKLIVIEKAGDWKLVLPVIVENGNWSTFGKDILDYDLPVVDSDLKELSGAFFEALVSTDLQWKRFSFYNVPKDCMELFQKFPMHERQPSKLKNLIGLLTLSTPGMYQTAQQVHPIVNLQVKDAQNIQDSSKWRKRLKAFSKLGKVEYFILREKEILSELAAFELLHRKKCHKMGMPSAFENSNFRDFLLNQISDSRLGKQTRLDKLTLSGVPVAYHFGYEDDARVYWYIPTYDPEFGQHSPGTVMTIFALDDARQRRLDFDFLRGRESYKDRFATEIRTTFRLELFRSASQKLGFIVSRR